MNRGRSLIILGVIAVAIGGVVWLFTGGSSSPVAVTDPAGDVVIAQGPKPPKQPRVVDVTAASVRADGSTKIFEATVARSVPDSFPSAAASFRWELSEAGTLTWIVTAHVGIDATASMAATQLEHRSSTIDDSLPGQLEIEGRTIRIEVDSDRLEVFPDSFAWRLETELDGDRTKAPSALAKDVVPDEGSAQAGS